MDTEAAVVTGRGAEYAAGERACGCGTEYVVFEFMHAEGAIVVPGCRHGESKPLRLRDGESVAGRCGERRFRLTLEGDGE